MKVIDFHMHPYLSREEFTCMYPEMFEPSPGQAYSDLEAAGISHICGSVIEKGVYTQESGFDHIRELNQKALRLKEIYGDFYTPGFHVHPRYVRESCDEIEFMHGKGVNLIGELVPYMHGWTDYSCSGLKEILDTAGQYGMVVSYHTMVEEEDEMEKMIAAHPDVTFVAAHPGEKVHYMRHLERLEKYPNAYLDLSGTGLFRYGLLAYGVKRAGADKFLFGTDYPICNPRMYVQAVLQEPISQADKEAVLCGNAKRLLGLR